MRVGIIAASLIAIAAAAATGAWEVRMVGPGGCAVDRIYDDGTRLSLLAHERGERTLSLFNLAWPAAGRGAYRFVLLRRGERRELKPGDPRFVIARALYMPLSEAQLGELKTGLAIEVVGADGAILKRLDLAGLAAASAGLPACFRRTAERDWPSMAAPPPPSPPPPPRSPVATPSRPRIPLHLLISADDYPAASLRAEEQGMVGFRLDIDSQGRVAACTITASSGFPILDSATCRLIQARARFHPAVGRDGQPVADRASGRILWKLQDPPPEPELPPT